jgi:hypothetical protein
MLYCSLPWLKSSSSTVMLWITITVCIGPLKIETFICTRTESVVLCWVALHGVPPTLKDISEWSSQSLRTIHDVCGSWGLSSAKRNSPFIFVAMLILIFRTSGYDEEQMLSALTLRWFTSIGLVLEIKEHGSKLSSLKELRHEIEGPVYLFQQKTLWGFVVLLFTAVKSA